MKFRLAVACVLSCLALSAVPLIPEGYKTLTDEEKTIIHDDFSNGLGGWQQTLPGVYSTAPNAGQNGRVGLVAKRTDPDTHPKLVRKFIGIPGKRYVARIFVRADNLQRTDIQGKQPTSLPIHPLYFDMFDAQDKYAAGVYTRVTLATGKSTEWKEVKQEFTIPKNAVKGNVTIGGYMPSDSGKITGTLYYSDFEIKLLGDVRAQLYPIRPSQLLLDNGGTITIRIHDFAERPESRLRVRAIADGKEFTAPVRNNDAVIAVGALPQGRHTITFQVLDTEAKTVIGQQDYTFTVPAPGDGDFLGSARIDDYGRLIIDGKPFATRMTCVSAHLKTTDVDRLVEAGYNAILPYFSMLMTIDSVDAKPRTIDCLRRSLDYLHSRGIKVIFCMKEQVQKGLMEFEGVKGQLEICEYIVRNLKRHPAILCWYITDENPLDEIPRAVELRHRISAIDPFHPVLTCTDKSQNQYHFAETGDIMNP
ncbi:MAG: hypothetical protein J5833_08670, partial [Victivallales bacterium]|nr:hypothetical protein [Victivallales bacterium]